jgi:hypothetical protein
MNTTTKVALISFVVAAVTIRIAYSTSIGRKLILGTAGA